MDLRNIFSVVPVPEHSTTNEVITVPCDSPSIQELFERAARGESLGGSYDEFDDDSIFDDIHDPDMQDDLLRESIRKQQIEDYEQGVRSVSAKRKTKSAKSKTDSSDDSDSGADHSGSSSKELSQESDT